MRLHPPFTISSRLLPGLKIADAWISLEFDGVTQDNRDRYRWYVDIGDAEYTDNDLCSGCGGGAMQDMFETLLVFMGAAAESRQYRERTGREGDNEDIFPAPLVDWLAAHSDEISMVRCEIQETPGLIEE